MRSIVVSLITVGLVSAHTTSRSRLVTFRAWDLKVPYETESIATFVSRLPRGGDYGYNDNGRYQDDPDDRYSQQSYSNDYYEDEYRYGDDRGYDDRGGDPSGPSFYLPSIIKTGNRKIGLPLLGTGFALTALGISLFF